MEPRRGSAGGRGSAEPQKARLPGGVLFGVLLLGAGLSGPTPGGRRAAAATYSDLGPAYAGATHSALDALHEDVVASLTVTGRNRFGNRFSGVFNDGGLAFEVSGSLMTIRTEGRSRSYLRLEFAGAYRADGTSLRITGTGQMSASGQFLAGSARESGTLEGQPFRDRVTFELALDDGSGEPGALSARRGKQPSKRRRP